MSTPNTDLAKGDQGFFATPPTPPSLRKGPGRWLRAALTLGKGLVFAASLGAEPAPGVTVISDIPFLGPDRSEKMDAYLPPASFPRPLPALLYIHGGAWVMGDKAEDRAKNIGTNLASQGIAVFSINYQLNKNCLLYTSPSPRDS